MGVLVDNFGWFYSPKSPLTWIRVVGAILVVVGVAIVSTSKQLETVKVSEKENVKIK